MKFFSLLAGTALAGLCVTHAHANDGNSHGHHHGPTAHQDHTSSHDKHNHDSHIGGNAPIGVMGDHRMKRGDFMVSYRYMNMDMDGSRDGTEQITPTEIATTVANPFAGAAGQPPTLRVVPTEMTMEMHMFGGMYGLSDRITLMAMTSYVRKEMDHTTFMGGMGDTVLGEFTTQSSGIGDTTLGAIVGLDDGSDHDRQINLNLLVSVPTGSNTRTDEILTPMGTTPSPRLPYPMQIGTGTWDAKPAVTYFDRAGKIGWGAQAKARIPLAKNNEDYRYGTSGEISAWMSYAPSKTISFSGRVKGTSQGTIEGQDSLIVAPVQTADPNNQGGDQLWALAGFSVTPQSGVLKRHRFAVEYGLPVHRNLNGPQLETDQVLTAGWQHAF